MRDWLADADTIDYTDRVLPIVSPPSGVAPMRVARALPGRATPANLPPRRRWASNERAYRGQTPPERYGKWLP